MTSKVVVTGGAGFIGSHIAEEISKKHDVVVYDNLHTGFLHNIEPLFKNNVEHVNASIMDFDALQAACEGAESIFHLAALISVPESMQKKTDYVTVNSLGTLQVLSAAQKAGVKNVVLSSSAAIYGDNPHVPKTENMLPEPKSPYAVTKLDGEYFLQMYRDEYGLNATSLRYFNVFGPRQDPQSQYAAAIPIFVSQAVKNEPITIFGDGEQTRDFIFVKDVVQANVLAAEKGGSVFNVGGGASITINQLAKKILEITGSKSALVYEPERPGDVRHSLADTSKIAKAWGFKPKADLDKGLTQTVDYFVKLYT